MLQRRLNDQAGFSIVEIILATAIFSILVGALAGIVVYGQKSSAVSGDRIRANQLAEEGIEAVRNIRNASYANLTDGTYGLAQSSNVWNLSGTSDTNGIFTRQTTIASGGTNRKDVTSTVTWNADGTSRSASVTSRLTNWRAAVAAVAKTWPNAIQGGSYDASGSQDALKVMTIGNYAYVVRGSGNPNFLVINVSNPAAPTLTGSLGLTGNPTNIYVEGNYAYVTNSADAAELQIINISNPAAPVLTSTYNATGTGNGNSVFVVGNTAYLARAADSTLFAYEMTFVNVSNPASPSLIGGYNNDGLSMTDVVVADGCAFIGTNSSTAEVLQLNILSLIVPLLTTSTNLTTSGTVTDLKVANGRVYVAQGPNLSIMDQSSLIPMNRLGTVISTGSGNINDITVDSSGNFVFLGTASSAAEFQVVNVATPASASVVRTVDVAGTSSSIYGVHYNTSLDMVAAVGASDTQEVTTFVKN